MNTRIYTTGRRLSIAVARSMLLAVILHLMVFGPAAQTASGVSAKPGVEYASYRAHIAAAASALRLDNTGDAKNWLAEAPRQYRGWEWDYLNAETEKSTARIEPGAGNVSTIAVSPDGAHIAFATAADRSVRIIRRSDNADVHRFPDPKLAPQSLAFSPDGSRIAAAYSGHVIRVWRLADGAESVKIQGNGKGITAVTFSPDGRTIASASWNRNEQRGVWGIVELHDSASGQMQKQLEYGTKPIVAVAYSPDGKYLGVGSWETDQGVAVWTTGAWGDAAVMEWDDNGIYKAVQSVAFSPDGTKIAAGGKDSVARIWNVGSGKTLHRLGGRGWGHGSWVNGVSFSPDGKVIATASSDQNIRLWDVAKGAELATLRGHIKTVNAVAYLPRGGELVSGSVDGSIRKWTAGSDVESGSILRPGAATYGIAFGPRNSIVTASWKGKLRVWDSSSSTIANEWDAHGSSANGVAYSRDGKHLASVGNDGAIKVWDAATGRAVRTLDTVQGPQLVNVGFTADGAVIAAASTGFAKAWDAGTGRELRSFAHDKGVIALAVSTDGRLLATGGSDGSIIVWNGLSGTRLATVAPIGSRVAALSFSVDGRTVAAALGRVVRIFDARSGKETASLTGHDESVNGVAFSPDGKRVVTASSDQTVRIWDPRTGMSILTLPFESSVWGAIFTPDGEGLVVLPLDGTVRILK